MNICDNLSLNSYIHWLHGKKPIFGIKLEKVDIDIGQGVLVKLKIDDALSLLPCVIILIAESTILHSNDK